MTDGVGTYDIPGIPSRILTVDGSGNLVTAGLRIYTPLGVLDPLTAGGSTTSFPGAVFDGVTDDSVAIQAVLSAASSVNSGGIVFPKGKSIKINTALTITACTGPVNFNYCKIDVSGIASGPAINLVPNTTAPLGLYGPISPINNFYLFGSNTDAMVTDGISITSNSSPIAGVTFSNFIIDGFRDGIVFGNNTYIIKFLNGQITHCHRRAVSLVGTTTAGEDMVFENIVFGNHTNATGNAAVGVYVDPNANAPDVVCIACVHDYSNIAFDIGSGRAQFVGNHFENSSNSPMGNISCTAAGFGGNGFPTHVTIMGGSLRHGGIAQANPESATGRPVMFQVTDITGTNQCQFETPGLQYKCNGRSATEFINVNAVSSNPSVRHYPLGFENRPGLNARICGYTNALYNGTFEIAGSTFYPGASGQLPIGTATNPPTLVTVAAAGSDGWSFSGAGTLTRDTAVFRSGTASLKIVGATQGGIAYSASMRVRPGDKFMQRGYINVTALTAGTMRFKMFFFNELGVEVAETSASPIVSAVTVEPWKQVDTIFSVPLGAETARAGVQWVGFAGTAYVDDVECWVF